MFVFFQRGSSALLFMKATFNKSQEMCLFTPKNNYVNFNYFQFEKHAKITSVTSYARNISDNIQRFKPFQKWDF